MISTLMIIIQDLIKILDKAPVAYACIELKAARATKLLGEYNHPNKEIEKWIKNNFSNMDSTLEDLVGFLTSCLPFGFSVAEIIFQAKTIQKRTEWRLKGFHYLCPDLITFQTYKGNLIGIKYSDGGKEVKIDYRKCIHITNGLCTKFGKKSVYGNPELKRAYPYIKLKQLLFAEMGVAAKTLATGIIVGKADSNLQIEKKDSKGNIIRTLTATENLAEELSLLENNSKIITDKANDIMTLGVPAGEQFWNLGKTLVDEQIMRAFLVPQMIWSEGSGALGIGALSNTQLSILDSSISSVVKRIQDKILETVIRPLIIYNFGYQESYGEFKFKAPPDVNSENIITQNLMTALSTGLFAPTTDLVAFNELRKRLNLPEMSSQDIVKNALLQSQIASAMQTSQASPSFSEEDSIPQE
jgi:hypothetical protein